MQCFHFLLFRRKLGKDQPTLRCSPYILIAACLAGKCVPRVRWSFCWSLQQHHAQSSRVEAGSNRGDDGRALVSLLGLAAGTCLPAPSLTQSYAASSNHEHLQKGEMGKPRYFHPGWHVVPGHCLEDTGIPLLPPAPGHGSLQLPP